MAKVQKDKNVKKKIKNNVIGIYIGEGFVGKTFQFFGPFLQLIDLKIGLQIQKVLLAKPFLTHKATLRKFPMCVWYKRRA
jgi:hypothetical protein